MSIGFTVQGTEANQRALDAIANALEGEMPAEVASAGTPVLYALAEYPAERPGQKYGRTGDLAASTYGLLEINGPEVTFKAGQTDPAAFWVGHETDYQAWMHKGRWQTAKAIAEKYAPIVAFKIIGAIDRIIARFWG